jgi:hypothetical protein
LLEMRDNSVSADNWQFLLTRSKERLSLQEWARLVNSLRLYAWFERVKVERDSLDVRIFRDLDTFNKSVLDNNCLVLFSFIASSLLFFCLVFQSCIKRFTISFKVFTRSSHLLISCFCRCNRVWRSLFSLIKLDSLSLN